MKDYRIYVGTKQSDLDSRDHFFNGSISYYGFPDKNHIVYTQNVRRDNRYEKEFIDYLIKQMKNHVNKRQNCRFVFYANKLAWKVIQHAPELKKNISCLNDQAVLNQLDNKIIFRTWALKYWNTINHEVLSKEQLISLVQNNDKRYIVQRSVSAGGEGTFLLDQSNFDFVYSQLSQNELYLISDFIQGTSVSCTIICLQTTVIVFPPNVQSSSVGLETDYRILFEGSNFIEGSKIDNKIKNKIYNTAKEIGERILEMGYRGVCGIDFMVHKNDVITLELNPRFLGSSFILNTALIDTKLPSLAYFHWAAFHNIDIPYDMRQAAEQIRVPYYSKVVTNRGAHTRCYMEKVLSLIDQQTKVYFDGFDPNNLKFTDMNAYLFRTLHYKDSEN